ncbi:MAG: hypothetical protein FJY67_01455 [Calditrichaeota bacterium]|nr:hypothetical protein [Calditrichota bacterium]
MHIARNVIIPVAILIQIILAGGKTMAHEGEGSLLGDSSLVTEAIALAKTGTDAQIVAFIESHSDSAGRAKFYVNAQCDVNNISHDPFASARIGELGVKYALRVGNKRAAAMMLHNIEAFFLPEFDENVDPKAKAILLDAARRQLPLRIELAESEPFIWAYWDLGMAEMISRNIVEAQAAFRAGAKLAEGKKDRNAEAWCNLFLGKIQVRHINKEAEEGRKAMLAAAKVIRELGEDWEKEEIVKILGSVGLELK